MPRHANITSFQPGHVRSEESIRRQQETVLAKYAAGYVAPHRGYKMPLEALVRRAATRRARALGNTTLQKCGSKTYRKVMTMDGYRYEHRVIMEQVLDRKLERSEHVHHINEDTLDNRPENLELKTAGEHSRHHHIGRPSVGKGKTTLRPGQWSREYGDSCSDCGTTRHPHFSNGRCKNCYQRWYRRKRLAEGRPISRKRHQ